MKKVVWVLGCLLVWLVIGCGCAPLASAESNLNYTPGRDRVWLKQDGITITLKGESLAEDPENGFIRLQTEVRNDTEQEISVWYTGTINGHDLNEGGWYLCTVPARGSAQAEIVNQEPILTVTHYEDLTTLQVHFQIYDASFATLLETDARRVCFSSRSGGDIVDEIPEDYSLYWYGGEDIVNWLMDLPSEMETVTTDGMEDILQLRLTGHGEDQMIGSFSIYDPKTEKEAINALRDDIPLAADRLIFDMYGFQRRGLQAYTTLEPINLPVLNRCMDVCWGDIRSLDFAAGCIYFNQTACWWMPVYYLDDEQPYMNDEVYLYVCMATQGADKALIEQMRVYDPSAGDYSLEQMLITDRAKVAEFLMLLQQEREMWTVSTDESRYYTLSENYGGDVSELQRRLTDLGYLTSSIDGTYGTTTMEAVKAYQEANGLQATGEADPHTQWLLLARQEDRALLQAWVQRYGDESGR